jgi:acetyl esterase/lipase
MTFTLDPEMAAALAPIAEAMKDSLLPAVGDVATRRATFEPLPAAYIEVGQLDIFRDDDLAYAQLLGRAGVDVEFHLHPGVPHEFETIAPHSDVSRRALADRIRVLSSV